MYVSEVCCLKYIWMMKKIIVGIGFLGILACGLVYAKKKFYDPKQANEIAKRAVSQLTEEHALKNGDLIFQTSLSRQSRAFNWQQNRSIRIAGSFMKKMVCSMF